MTSVLQQRAPVAVASTARVAPPRRSKRYDPAEAEADVVGGGTERRADVTDADAAAHRRDLPREDSAAADRDGEKDDEEEVHRLRVELAQMKKSMGRMTKDARDHELETMRLRVRIEMLTNERDAYRKYRDVCEEMKAEMNRVREERDDLRRMVAASSLAAGNRAVDEATTRGDAADDATTRKGDGNGSKYRQQNAENGGGLRKQQRGGFFTNALHWSNGTGGGGGRRHSLVGSVQWPQTAPKDDENQTRRRCNSNPEFFDDLSIMTDAFTVTTAATNESGRSGGQQRAKTRGSASLVGSLFGSNNAAAAAAAAHFNGQRQPPTPTGAPKRSTSNGSIASAIFGGGGSSNVAERDDRSQASGSSLAEAIWSSITGSGGADGVGSGSSSDDDADFREMTEMSELGDAAAPAVPAPLRSRSSGESRRRRQRRRRQHYDGMRGPENEPILRLDLDGDDGDCGFLSWEDARRGAGGEEEKDARNDEELPPPSPRSAKAHPRSHEAHDDDEETGLEDAAPAAPSPEGSSGGRSGRSPRARVHPEYGGRGNDDEPTAPPGGPADEEGPLTREESAPMLGGPRRRARGKAKRRNTAGDVASFMVCLQGMLDNPEVADVMNEI